MLAAFIIVLGTVSGAHAQDPDPICVISGPCATAALMEYSVSGSTTTMVFRLTNDICANALSHVSFGIDPAEINPPNVPDWDPLSPTDGSSYLGPLEGILFDVIWTGNIGLPGYPAIKYEVNGTPEFDAGLTEEFTIQLTDYDENDPIAVEFKYGGTSDFVYFEMDDRSANCGGPPLAVTMSGFDAHYTGTAINVTWETASELNNVGFHLWHAESLAGPVARLNGAIIPSREPGSPTGHSYDWLHEPALTLGATHYYWLDSIDAYGQIERFGPVSVTISPPTAVTLSDFQSSSSSLGLAILMILLLAGTGLAVRLRRRPV